VRNDSLRNGQKPLSAPSIYPSYLRFRSLVVLPLMNAV